jgi:hypothetical protein
MVAMRERHPHFDPNSVRPRLTSLRDKGQIVGDRKRRCRITGRVAWTWAIADSVNSSASESEMAATANTPGARQTVLDLHWSGGQG